MIRTYKLRIKRNKIIFYTIALIILSSISIHVIFSSFRKENSIKGSRMKPPSHHHKNKVSVVNESEINKMLEDSIDLSTLKKHKESIEKNKMMINHFKKYVFNTIDSVNELTNMNLLREKTELHRMLWESLFGSEIFTSDSVLKTMLQYQENNSSLLKLFNKVHKNLYPWIYGKKYLAIDELLSSFKGRGIVICTGSTHYKYALSTIDTLRNVIKTKLPIEVFYNGKDELSDEEQQGLMIYPNVFLSDIEDYFNNDIIKSKKWAIKPFALLASRFMEVILIDADAMFIRDPAELFKTRGYEETGTLFFRDRTLQKPYINDSLNWFKEWAKNPLPETKSSRFWNGITVHEMDSSTVVINKEKAILGLFSVCKLNENVIREGMVYHHVYGDKETFWMGFDMARQHYYMSEQPISFIGSVHTASSDDGSNKDRQMLCGHIAHTLDDGRIIFWNGHLVVDKDYNSSTLMDFDSYIVEKDTDDTHKWTSEPICYYIDDEKDVNPLPKDAKVVIDMIMDRENRYHILLD